HLYAADAGGFPLDEIVGALEDIVLRLPPGGCRLEVWIEGARDGELDIVGGHLHAVVEQHAFAQVEGPDPAVAGDGGRPGREVELGQGVAVEPVQPVEERTVDQPPVLVKRLSRIKGGGVAGEGHVDRPAWDRSCGGTVARRRARGDG